MAVAFSKERVGLVLYLCLFGFSFLLIWEAHQSSVLTSVSILRNHCALYPSTVLSLQLSTVTVFESDCNFSVVDCVDVGFWDIEN